MSSSSDAKHLQHETEDGKYPASIYYNATPAEIHFNTPVPVFLNREERRGNFTHTQVQSQPFTQVGAHFVSKKIPALLKTSSLTKNQRQKQFGGKFPANASVSSQTWV